MCFAVYVKLFAMFFVFCFAFVFLSCVMCVCVCAASDLDFRVSDQLDISGKARHHGP